MVLLNFSYFVKNFGEIPVRLNVAAMIFVACMISFMLRTNLSINILAMVEPPATATVTVVESVPLLDEGIPRSGGNLSLENDHTNGTAVLTTAIDKATTIILNSNATTMMPDYGERYPWTETDKSLLLGAYFWGYLVSTLIGGFLADRFGAATVILHTMILCTIITALSPIAASWGFWYIYFARVLTGLFGGPLFPALQNLIAKWAPPDEKGKFMSMLMGGNLGTVITWPIIGVVIESFGWVYGFYLPAILSAIATVLWWYLVTDSPTCHPRITQAEKDYIENSSQANLSKKKLSPPIWKLLCSPPFWALLALHYGSVWGNYFLLTAAPKFMNEVLGFYLTKAGVLAGLPYLARMICGFGFGMVGDTIRKKEKLTITNIRRLFAMFSHVIPGLLLIAICFVGYRPILCVVIITLSMGFNGASTLTNLQNSQDLAPNFAASIYSLMNFVATTSGFLSPLVVAHFTAENNGIGEWHNVFVVGAVVYIIPAVSFLFFGSGEVQPWNNIEPDTEADPTPNVEATNKPIQKKIIFHPLLPAETDNTGVFFRAVIVVWDNLRCFRVDFHGVHDFFCTTTL